MKYSIVIPCYNESENIHNVIQEFKKLNLSKEELELVLVENGSIDNTAKMIQRHANHVDFIKIVNVPVNKGYGYGIKQGLYASTGEIVGWLHADLQIKPQVLLDFFEYINKYSNKEKLFLKGKRKNRPFSQRIVTFCMSIFETILFGKVMNDIGAIPVMFSRDLLKFMKDAPNDFAIELYTYYVALREKKDIVRLDVVMEEREYGESSWAGGIKSVFKQSSRIIKASIKIKKKENRRK